MKALIASLSLQEPDEAKNVHCRFPARLRWLRERGHTVPPAPIPCTKLEAFRARMSARSVAVVFSSYYLNNPASSFGHTLIRLGKHPGTDAEDRTAMELLDTGINYGALTGDAGPLLYSLGGLTGFFIGTFDAIPYYYKVRLYNDYESRDLWSYHLDLSEAETTMLVDHLWELGHTHFDYYFLKENCSYHVLAALEAVRPSLRLVERLPRLYTIPSETLKALHAEGLVRKTSFRPSPATQFQHQLGLLDADERQQVEGLVYAGKAPSALSLDRRALIYDTALSLIDFKHAKELAKLDGKGLPIKKPILLGRSKIPVRSPDLDFSAKMEQAPHLGHGQKRLILGAAQRDGRQYMDAEWRFAFHDPLDNDTGYPPRTRLEVMKAVGRTDGVNHQLRELLLVDASSLGQWDQFSRPLSWKARLGQWQTRHDGEDLTSWGFTGGAGYARPISLLTPFAMLHGEVAHVPEKVHRGKFAWGADAGLLAEFTRSWKFQSLLEWRAKPWDESRVANELRFSSAAYGLGVFHHAYLVDGTSEAGIKSLFYF